MQRAGDMGGCCLLSSLHRLKTDASVDGRKGDAGFREETIDFIDHITRHTQSLETIITP